MPTKVTGSKKLPNSITKIKIKARVYSKYRSQRLTSLLSFQQMLGPPLCQALCWAPKERTWTKTDPGEMAQHKRPTNPPGPRCQGHSSHDKGEQKLHGKLECAAEWEGSMGRHGDECTMHTYSHADYLGSKVTERKKVYKRSGSQQRLDHKGLWTFF